MTLKDELAEVSLKLSAVTEQWFRARRAWEAQGRPTDTTEAQTFGLVNRELLTLRQRRDELQAAQQEQKARREAQERERDRWAKLLVQEELLPMDQVAALEDDDWTSREIQELIGLGEARVQARVDRERRYAHRLAEQRHPQREVGQPRPRRSGKTERERAKRAGRG